LRDQQDGGIVGLLAITDQRCDAVYELADVVGAALAGAVQEQDKRELAVRGYAGRPVGR